MEKQVYSIFVNVSKLSKAWKDSKNEDRKGITVTVVLDISRHLEFQNFIVYT
jgi:hypothetical protein